MISLFYPKRRIDPLKQLSITKLIITYGLSTKSFGMRSNIVLDNRIVLLSMTWLRTVQIIPHSSGPLLVLNAVRVQLQVFKLIMVSSMIQLILLRISMSCFKVILAVTLTISLTYPVIMLIQFFVFATFLQPQLR